MEMRKRSNRRPVVASAKALNDVLFSRNAEDLPQSEADRMMIRPHARLRELKTNRLTLDGFIDLNEMNALGFSIAAIIYHEGGDIEKAALADKQSIFETAANALQSIGLRFGKTGKMRALPDEFDAVRHSILLLDQLYAVSTKGVAYRAMEQAREMVDEKLKQSVKGGGK